MYKNNKDRNKYLKALVQDLEYLNQEAAEKTADLAKINALIEKCLKNSASFIKEVDKSLQEKLDRTRHN